MSMEPQHYHEDLPAFALDALDPDERRVVEAHIAVCVSCRLAAEEVRCVVEQLAFTAPLLRPSPKLKERLMARIAADRRAQRPPTRRLLRVSQAVMAAMLAVLLLWNIHMTSQVSSLSNERAKLSAQLQTEWEILAQQDRISRTLVGTANAPDARGTIFMQPGSPKAMVIVDGLDPLPSTKVYKCWLIRNGATYPNAAFNVSDQGHAGVVIEAGDTMESYSKLLITIDSSNNTGSPGETVLMGDL